MTRSEIMLMPKEELRIKAAELDGWTEIGYWKTTIDGRVVKVNKEMGLWGILPSTENDSERLSQPLPNYPNDTTAAIELWDQIAEPKEIVWEDGYICLSWGESPLETWIKGKIIASDTLPDLLTRAYVWAKTP